MHELSVTESLLNIINEEADKNNACKVISVNLILGELTYIIPDCLQIYFDFLSKGTKAEGAKLNVKMVDGKKKCYNCGTIMNMSLEFCPKCKKTDFKLINGFEFYIESIEVE